MGADRMVYKGRRRLVNAKHEATRMMEEYMMMLFMKVVDWSLC